MKKNNSDNLLAMLCMAFAVLPILLSNCKSETKKENFVLQKNLTKTSVKPFTIKHATGFDITYKAGYKLLHIFNFFKDKQDTTSYLLLPHETKIPREYRNYRIIRTPVKKIITMSSTHVGLLSALGELNTIVGHANVTHIYNNEFQKRVKEGKITEVGRDANLNTEVVLSLEPGAVIAVGMHSQVRDAYAVLEEAGIPVIYNSEWQENSLLARAEWIKMAAALFDKEKETDEKFTSINSSYDSLKRLSAKAISKPLFMANSPVKGTWYLPGGKSYIAKLIADAGGDYYWKNNTESGSFVVPFENAFEVASRADYWINVRMSGPNGSLAELDERLADFRAYKNGNVYNFTKRVSETGANDYWESGVTNPHLILKDLIKICHPELLPDYSLYYYEKINK